MYIQTYTYTDIYLSIYLSIYLYQNYTYVERETVVAHPSRELHTHGARLLPTHPHARQPLLPAGALDAQRAERPDRDLLQRAHVPVHVLRKRRWG